MTASNTDLFLKQLRSIRNSMASTVDQIDVLLDLAERPPDDGAPHACPHPMAARVPKAAMGHPNRFYCRVCEQTTEE